MKRILTGIGSFLAVLAVIISLIAGTAFADSAGTDPIFNTDDLFTGRDQEQAADLSGAVSVDMNSGSDVLITEEGVYVLSGTVSETTVRVEAPSDAKVQIVLDGVSITNSSFPCIYVISADKVFITVSADSSLAVTGPFAADGSTNADGVIFSKQDLVLNGTASLAVSSADNGIVCKDDLKITGGCYIIEASSKAIEANDSIRICGGSFTLTAGTDALHAENADDDSLGYVYISGGEISIRAGDDGIHAVSVVQIDGGTLSISAGEGIEATVIQVNGGTVSIAASDDGINAAAKSASLTPSVIFNGGDTSIIMGQGDTDGVDSNGNIYVNGGTVSVTGNSTFDYDGIAEYSGGTIICNGTQVTEIPNQMMGGPGGMRNNGGWGQQPDGGPNGGGWGGRGGRR